MGNGGVVWRLQDLEMTHAASRGVWGSLLFAVQSRKKVAVTALPQLHS